MEGGVAVRVDVKDVEAGCVQRAHHVGPPLETRAVGRVVTCASATEREVD